MLAAYNKFDSFTDFLVRGQVNFASDVFKFMLTDTSPVRTNQFKTQLIDIPVGNGYPAGGLAAAITLQNVAGLETVTAADVTFTATGGSIGPFRYAALFDDTAPQKILVCWFDWGQEVLLANTSTFTIEPNASSPSGTLYTLQ